MVREMERFPWPQAVERMAYAGEISQGSEVGEIQLQPPEDPVERVVARDHDVGRRERRIRYLGVKRGRVGGTGGHFLPGAAGSARYAACILSGRRSEERRVGKEGRSRDAVEQ